MSSLIICTRRCFFVEVVRLCNVLTFAKLPWLGFNGLSDALQSTPPRLGRIKQLLLLLPANEADDDEPEVLGHVDTIRTRYALMV